MKMSRQYFKIAQLCGKNALHVYKYLNINFQCFAENYFEWKIDSFYRHHVQYDRETQIDVNFILFMDIKNYNEAMMMPLKLLLLL